MTTLYSFIELKDKDPSEMGFEQFTNLIQNTLPLTYSNLMEKKIIAIQIWWKRIQHNRKVLDQEWWPPLIDTDDITYEDWVIHDNTKIKTIKKRNVFITTLIFLYMYIKNYFYN